MARCEGIRNPESLKHKALESGIQSVGSGIRCMESRFISAEPVSLESANQLLGIRDPFSGFGIHRLASGTWNLGGHLDFFIKGEK